MPEDWAWYLLLLPVGFIAGVVNTIAGGGSFLTLPALMWCCGLPAQTANGSNRIAILIQSGYGTHLYRKQGRLDGPASLRLLPPMLLGAVAGAYLASVLAPDVFEIVFGVLFLLMAGVMAANPKALLATGIKPRGSAWVEVPLFIGLGLYAGFIQAGVGVLLLISLSLCSGLDLSRANGVKLAVVAVVQVLALGIFAWQGQVDWIAGAVLAAGNTAGAPLGAKLAMRKGAKLIFAFVLIVMVATGAKLLWPALPWG